MDLIKPLLIIAVTIWTYKNLMFGECWVTPEEVEIAKSLGLYHSIKYFVFLQNKTHFTNMMEVQKNLSQSQLFSTSINWTVLNAILQNESSQFNFLKRKILLVTMEPLNYTEIVPRVLFPRSLVWAVFAPPDVDVSKYCIPPNTKFFLIQSISNRVVMHRIYKVHQDTSLVVQGYGSWVKGQPIVIPYYDDSNRIDFENVSLRTLVHLHADDDTCMVQYKLILFKMRCFHTELIGIVSKALNFRANIIKYLDIDHPYFGKNDSLAEVFLLLQDREVDISGCTYTVDNERKKQYDFAWPTFSPRSMLYIKNEPGGSFWQAYIKPFHIKIHYIIVSWIFFSGLIIQIFKHLRTSMPNMSQWCSDRVVYLGTFLFVVLIYQGYSAKLISSLTVVAPNIPFLTFDDLIRDGRYKLMTLVEGFHQIVFIKYLRNLGMGHMVVRHEELPVNAQDAVSKLCSNDHLVYIEFRENIVQHDMDCEITEIPKSVFSYYMGLGLPKNSPYTEFVTRELTRVYSSGLMNRMRRHLLSYEKLRHPIVDGYISVTLEQVIFPFSILLAGILLSMLLLAGEIYWRRKISTRRKTRRPFQRSLNLLPRRSFSPMVGLEVSRQTNKLNSLISNRLSSVSTVTNNHKQRVTPKK
ncbi:hypothetical protein RUM43_010773 [Polyplax serrata]|uniref:Uncharacterized protein n=1 Tax=Polyplax serrata TaxID=468196 RepID=A0AAN8P4I8_POLSC